MDLFQEAQENLILKALIKSKDDNTVFHDKENSAFQERHHNFF